ncbi:MAG: hypothetical protein WAN04_00005, partial [Candidatus Udaeobacter sp.]
MDEKVEEATSETEAVKAGVSPADTQRAPDTAAAAAEREAEVPGSSASAKASADKPIPATVRSLDLNELQEFSGKQLKALARDLNLFLQPTRSRHQHILDIVRTALTGGA